MGDLTGDDLTRRAEKLASRLVGDEQPIDAETVRLLLAEVERLRAAAPASEDDVPPAVAADLAAHGPMPYAPGISDVAGSPPPTPAPTAALLRELAEARREYAESGPDDHRSAIAHEAEVFDVAASVIENPSRWRDVIACYAPSWRWREFDDLLAALPSERVPPLATATTAELVTGDAVGSLITLVLPVPPGTAVEVREARTG